jgi:hemoglobin
MAPQSQAPPLGVLLFSAEKLEYSNSLLYRMGGEDALETIILTFYERIMKDPQLHPFFASINMASLRAHQKRFMIMAFSEIPKDFDVAAIIIERHYRLFNMGLNETHFDLLVAGHLVAALQQMGVQQEVIDEVVGILGPFRKVFVKAGRNEKIIEYMKEQYMQELTKEKQEREDLCNKSRKESKQRSRKGPSSSNKDQGNIGFLPHRFSWRLGVLRSIRESWTRDRL